MAIPILDELGRDLERLVWSGALSARGDARLEEHAAALEALAGRVPALGKVAERVRALSGASAADAPAALLQLDLSVQQLRVATSEATSRDEMSEPVRSCDASTFAAVPPHALYGFLDATQSKKKPGESVVLALETMPFGNDPRATEALVAALDHRYLAPHVVKAVGEIGTRVLPALEASLKLKGKGKAGDAERLRAIGRIRKAEGADLYRKALEKGSVPVKVAALECLRWVSAEEVENAAVAAFDAAKNRVERAPFLPALVRCESEPALSRAVTGLANAGDEIIRESLAGLPDEAATTVVRLARERLEGDEGSSLAERPVFMRWLVDAGRPEALEILMRLLHAKGPAGRAPAAQNLVELRDPVGLEAVVNAGFDDELLHPAMALALFALGPDVAYDRMAPLLAPYLAAAESAPQPAQPKRHGLLGKVGRLLGGDASPPEERPRPPLDPRLGAVLDRLGPGADPRWLDALVAMLDVDPDTALRVLPSLGDERAIRPMLALLGHGEPLHLDVIVFSALSRMRAREALPMMLEWMHAHLDYQGLGPVIAAVRDMGDPSAVPALKKMHGDRRISEFAKQFIEHVIFVLESKA